MESGDGVLAWEALRRVEDYEDAWRRHGADGSAHALEPGPFRIRIQTQADLRAGRSLREIAIDLFGAERVAAEWHPDGSMRADVRRLVQRAATPGQKACE